ncbi:IMP cyclohydrolase [Streptomyces sp. NPDC021224]|uniref:IMP cyclohydrolase n=1 Tax=unclassified Streptomyces TaxID=2593676 RepID=UPI0037B1A23E
MSGSLGDVLRGNRYPGRGVLWCRTADGEVCGGYFLTGRTAASRGRTLRLTTDDELIVGPADDRAHDALRHYTAARQSGEWLVFGNGEQVATVAGRLAAGQAPAEALDGLDYEPDPPILTRRLTVVASAGSAAPVWFGAARHSGAARTATDRLTLRVGALEPGEGVLMTTYLSDGVTVATGAPFTQTRTTAADRAELLDDIWSALTPELRVAAATFAPHGLAAAGIRQALPVS